MKDVSEKGGRTVLFVSHNMGAISTLCDRGLLLINGNVNCNDNIESVVKQYLNTGLNSNADFKNTNNNLNESIYSIKISNESENSTFNFAKPIKIFFDKTFV